jgi:hypothetical protein
LCYILTFSNYLFESSTSKKRKNRKEKGKKNIKQKKKRKNKKALNGPGYTRAGGVRRLVRADLVSV